METKETKNRTLLKDFLGNIQLSRRSFIKASAATGAAVAFGAGMKPQLKALAAAAPSEAAKTGQWMAATCQGCTSWCSKQVYVVDGRAVKVRGNPHSKVNLGAGCVRSHLATQQLYDPDRIKVPMKRTNPKKGRNEDPKFVPISWDEALDTIADKIMELRNNHETHKYMLMRGRYSYMRDILYDRMTKIIGSPNNISHSALCAEAEKFGPYYTEGYWGYRQYDVLKAHYILLWGADPLAANRQVSYYTKVWGDVADRATIAIIEPRLSASAGKADEWLPIVPGQDAALAVAIAHILLAQRPLVQTIRRGFRRRHQPVRPRRDGGRGNLRREVHPRGRQMVEPGTQGQNSRLGGLRHGPARRSDPSRGRRLRQRGTACHFLGGRRSLHAGARRLCQHGLPCLERPGGCGRQCGGHSGQQQGIHRASSQSRTTSWTISPKKEKSTKRSTSAGACIFPA